MTREELNNFIKQWENAKVDFKREWYWNDNMPNNVKEVHKNELVKDLIALTNGDVYSIDKTAYLIIGIDDETREIYNFNKSTILPLDKLKQQLLTLLNNYAQPEFLALEIEFLDEVLIISIPPHGSLISLSKDLKLKNNNTDKKGTTYYRVGEDIRVASSEVVGEFDKILGNDKQSVSISINGDVKGVVNAESGSVINQYFYRTTVPSPKNNKSIDDKKCKEIEEYPFYRNIEEDKYICRKGQISIEANLPKVNFPMSFLIECKVTFRLENNRTLMINLDNEATLKELFSLYMYIFEEKNEENNKIITYKSNNLTLEISIGTFNTLIKIANDLQEVYTERIIQLEEKLDSKGFNLSKEYENGFELCEISYKLWIKIIEFIQKHIRCDTSHRINEWDIFRDSNATYFIWTYKTIINHSIKYRYSYHLDVKEPIRIVLVWDTLKFFSDGDDEIEILTVRESCNWLTEKLIETIKDEMIGDMDTCSMDKYDGIMDEYFNIQPLCDVEDEEYKNKEFVAIGKIINSLYHFHNSIIFNKEHLKILYESLIFLLENSKSLDIVSLNKLFYYIGNINTIPVSLKDGKISNFTKISNPTKEYFINRINIELEEIKKGDMSMKELIGGSSYTLQEIFNCYTVIFDTNGEADYPTIVISELYQKLKYFEKISNVFSTRDKMMMPFWD